MKTVKIYLNDTNWIDLAKLIVSKLLAVANSGGGKSWLVRRIIEQAFGKVQIIVIDPEGEFATLREKYDFILCGKGMDAPAEPRSAALLARKLLESKSSAIIDLYELHPQERKKFVRIFFEAMVNAPKELYNDCLIFLDEAHKFAPEKEESEATSAVIEMASLGRKRGFCLIPVTQRVSKLSKDVAAECNNKLMGRASLDLDRKRTADELGITNKEEVLALRNLEPGEFFAFGPAISNEVTRLKVGPVQTSIPKAGRQTKVAPPSAKVKKELAALADLPAEAEEEARSVADLTQQVKTLKHELKIRPVEKVEQGPMGVSQWMSYGAKYGYDKFFQDKMTEAWKAILDTRSLLMKHKLEDIAKALGAAFKLLEADPNPIQMPKKLVPPPPRDIRENMHPVKMTIEKKEVYNREPKPSAVFHDEDKPSINGPEQRILDAIAWMESIGVDAPEQTAVAFLADYKIGGGAFNNPKGSLRGKGLIEYRGSCLALTDSGRGLARAPEGVLDTEALHQKVMARLPGPEQKLLKPLLEAYPNAMSNAELAAAAGYEEGGGAFNNPKGKLRTLGLVDYPSKGLVKASSILFL